MRPSRRPCVYASLALGISLLAPRTHAKNLTITSSPPGARVEINSHFAGRTPYTTDYPGSYFHKPHTVFSSRLDRAMVVRVSKDGYVPEEVTITNGPFTWTSINGRHRGSYFLLKASHFDIRLEPLSTAIGEPIETIDGEGPVRPPNSADVQTGESDARTDPGTVTIASTPSGAEIYLDGRFVGQTPATCQLASGLHHVEVRFSDKQKWERDLHVLRGSKLTLRAAAEALP